MIDIIQAIVSYDDLVRQGQELAQALEDAQKNADVLFIMTTERNAANQALEAAKGKIEEDQRIISSHVATILRLQEQIKPPPIISSVRKPTITKTEIRNVAGVTLANDLVSPDDNQYDRMRLNLMLISGMGFNVGRWYMGKAELNKTLALPETNIAHLPGFARSLGITYGADTVDRAVFDTLKIEDDPLADAKAKVIAIGELEVYLKGLEKLAAFFVINDINQYPLVSFPAITSGRIVERIRSITPNMPIIGSTTANVDISLYKRQPNDLPDVANRKVDYLEAQTFGTVNEFKLFLGRKFDVFCLDGRKTATKSYLQQITPAFLAANPSNFFFYPTTVTDWLSMPGQMSVIRDMVSKWWTQPR
jgi:hypothetical protein